jgi:WD40 repeat protein
MRRITVVFSLLVAAHIGVGCASQRDVAPPAAAKDTSAASAEAVTPAAAATLPTRITSLVAINRSTSVAMGLGDGQVAIWTTTGAPVLMKPHGRSVLAVGSSKDGAEVWSLSEDGSLARTRPAAGAPPVVLKVDLGTAPTRAAAFSADGALLLTGGEFGDVRVFDTATGGLRHTLRGHRTELQALAVRPGSTVAATVSAEADLRLWDTAAGTALTAIEQDLSLFAVAFSPGDGTLASGGVDRRVTLRDSTFAVKATVALKAPMMVAALAWSPDGRLLAIGDIDDGTLAKGGLRVVDATTRATVATFDTGGMPPAAVTFTSDGKVLVGLVGRDVRAWPVPPAK